MYSCSTHKDSAKCDLYYIPKVQHFEKTRNFVEPHRVCSLERVSVALA
jgi:hypothetical protein